MGNHAITGPRAHGVHKKGYSVSSTTGRSTNADLTLNHVEFYVGDARARADEFVYGYGFEAFATSGGDGSGQFSVALRQGAIILIFTEPRSERSPAHAFLAQHGDGVADVALRTSDARMMFDQVVARGGRPSAAPTQPDGLRGGVIAAIYGFGDVRHTFVQAPDHVSDGLFLPGFVLSDKNAVHTGVGLIGLDHFAVCLEVGELRPTVAFYESVLGFRIIFEERIVVGTQAMLSQVVQNASQSVTLTLIQPDPTADAGQIDNFVKEHGGAGVQHIAFSAGDVVNTVSKLVDRGIEFLDIPDAYYQMLRNRINLAAHTVEEFRRLNVLADEDHDGQLFQIFTRSTHPRRTFFLEIIERLGARTFGSGNIKALYEAVEAEQANSRALSCDWGS